MWSHRSDTRLWYKWLKEMGNPGKFKILWYLRDNIEGRVLALQAANTTSIPAMQMALTRVTPSTELEVIREH